MRDPNPVSGVPDNTRGYNHASQDRYGPLTGKGPAGQYEFKPVTLEEEARAGGWLPGARPTGPDPIDLFTLGMRGEPGYDDDPSPARDGRGYSHPDGDGGGSDNSYD